MSLLGVRCSLFVVCCRLSVGGCLLCVAHRVVVCCLLFVVCCMLPIVLLFVVCCSLCAVRWLWLVAFCMLCAGCKVLSVMV